MAIKGSLREASLPDVIQLLSMGRKTGILSVTDRRDFGNVYLNDGKIIYATIVNRMDRIGDLLIRDGRITQEDLNDAIKNQNRNRNTKKLGTILVELNLISSDEIKEYLRMQIEETISHLLSWTDGFFNFEPNTGIDEEDMILSLSTNDLLLEGTRRVDEWRVIRQKISSLKLIPRFKKGYTIDDINFEDDKDRSILEHVDGDNSVEDLLSICHLDEFTVCRSLHRHLTQNKIELIEKADEKKETSKKTTLRQLDEYMNLAVAFFKAEMYREAEREYKRVLEINSNHLEALFHLGLIAFYDENYDEAVDFFQKALNISPKNPHIYNNMGLAYEKIRSFSGAMAAYQKAIEINPEFATAYYNLAYLQYQTENYEKAVENFKKTIELDPKCGAAYFYIASALIQQGMVDYALMWYKRGLEIDPENAIIHNNIGVLCQHKHMHEEASKYYQEASRLDPTLAMPHCNIGDLYYRGGWHEKAEMEFKRAIELDPKLPVVYFKMGNISLKHGQLDQAVVYWEKALKYDPDNALIKRNLKMIKGAPSIR